MNYNIARPSQFLSQYVKQYWSMDYCFPEGKEHIQRIVPNGLFELAFYLNDKPKTTDPRKTIDESIILSGQIPTYHDLKVSGNLSLFAIYFLPHGLSVFLDLPLKELFNYSIPLKYIVKDAAKELEDKLSIAKSFEEQISIAESFLISRIQKNEKNYKHDRIRHIVNLINQSKGNIEINQLVSEAFLSRKQFERSFKEIVGTSPKQFLKTVRFQNAIYEKSRNSSLSLTETAYTCGYFDQAHMINDFKSLSGITPKNYFKQGAVYSDYFE